MPDSPACLTYLARTLNSYTGGNHTASSFAGMTPGEAGYTVALAGSQASPPRVPINIVNGMTVSPPGSFCEAFERIYRNEIPVSDSESEKECRDALQNEHILPLGLDVAILEQSPRRVLLDVALGYVRAERLPADVYNTEVRELQNASSLCETLSVVNRLLATFPPGPYVSGETTPEQAAQINQIRNTNRLRRLAAPAALALLAWKVLA
jgi:hypothetical protein